MLIKDKDNHYLHSKLPIDADEKILAVYKHHWFAYASNWLVGIGLVIIIMAIAIALTSLSGTEGTVAQHKGQIIAGAAGFSVLILLGTMLPVYLRSQEQLVLTEEALLQVLQPSLFASKIDQLNLQHIDDVSVRQDFFGTMLGYGHLTIETPGEQDNYEFYMLPDPHRSAREISQAHENYDAALQAGRMPTTLGEAPRAVVPQIDPAQYQQFLEFQQMQARQNGAQPTDYQAQPQSAQPAQQLVNPQYSQPNTPPVPAQGENDDSSSSNTASQS